MFKHLLEWYHFKKKLLSKYKAQINQSLYKKVNQGLLITATKMGNDALFQEIISSPFLNDALIECDSDNKNALYYALSHNNDYYEQLISKGAVLSTYPSEADEMVLLKYQELAAYRQKKSPYCYWRYLKRLKDQIKQMYHINYEAMNGHSLMTMAVLNNDISMVDYLLSLNASPLSGRIDIDANDLNAYELAVYNGYTNIQQHLHDAISKDKQQAATIIADEKCAAIEENKKSGKTTEIVRNCMGLLILGALICMGLHDCSTKTSSQSQKPVPIQPQRHISIKNLQINEK